MQLMQLTKAQVKAGRFWREWERNGRWVCGRCGKPEARPHEHAWLGRDSWECTARVPLGEGQRD